MSVNVSAGRRSYQPLPKKAFSNDSPLSGWIPPSLPSIVITVPP